MDLLNMPVIETKRLILRPVTLDDLYDMYEYGSDAEVTKYLSWKPYQSINDAELSIRNFFLKKVEMGVPESYAIVFKENNKMIGVCDFVTLNLLHRYAEIGYAMNRHYWGKGIMVEAVNELIRLGFERFQLVRIQIQHDVNNIQSQRVIEKLGFKFEGIRRKALKNGQGIPCDLRSYSLLLDEYKFGTNDLMNVIETKRLTIRPLKYTDYPYVYKTLSNPNVTQYLTAKPLTSIDEAKNRVHQMIMNAKYNNLPEAMAIVDKDSNQFIGLISYSIFNEKRSFVEIAYHLDESYWGKGLMYEACIGMIQYAFDNLGMNRVEITHMLDNIQSQRVIEKCGFIYEGIKKNAAKNQRDQYVDVVSYAITKDQYLKEELPWQKN